MVETLNVDICVIGAGSGGLKQRLVDGEWIDVGSLVISITSGTDTCILPASS